ncbi:NAD-dependent epimerase [Albimonas pacifica]|uniref:UDP-glucuronate 4-epimerase n=1 Tax=Albimonas pacifica TaxID=1114924 RepID=A0A1I3PRU7_9RHOB|nr:NAD-dependent epimerase [Albimonas pacifica]SFJ24233.1 UDP-glucuronate 4-epimerase [Albimonas pacifica]
MTASQTDLPPQMWAEALPDDRPVLVTGAAGFVGAFVASRLLAAGKKVVGLDNLNAYYDPALKQGRLEWLLPEAGFDFRRMDLADREGIAALFAEHRFAHVVHLGAQAGVRYSIENPHAYADSNLTGFLNILEGCRAVKTEHLVYASSSSVYGGNRKTPFRVSDSVDHPVSLYAATKKANELMAHAYADLYGLASTGLRFFTVYGPWGRPDMAYWLFTQAILEGRPIKVFNNGDMLRDFTYVDDIVESVLRLVPRPPKPDPDFDRMNPDPGRSWAPHRVFNIGNSRSEKLMDLISLIEEATGREAIKEFLPMQPGDVQATFADVSALEAEVDFAPATPLSEGIPRFVEWYRGRNAG